MAGFFRSQWRRFFPLSERQAVNIAIAKCSMKRRPDKLAFRVSNEKPNIYLANAIEEPCWYVFAPREENLEVSILCSGRVIAVSKITGAVLYDGSANDEG